MNLRNVASRVAHGSTVRFRARGHSMEPRIRSGEIVTVKPIDEGDFSDGDIVLAKVRGRWWLHLAKTKEKHSVLITNNKGHANGWTHHRNVIGKVIDDQFHASQGR